MTWGSKDLREDQELKETREGKVTMESKDPEVPKVNLEEMELKERRVTK